MNIRSTTTVTAVTSTKEIFSQNNIFDSLAGSNAIAAWHYDAEVCRLLPDISEDVVRSGQYGRCQGNSKHQSDGRATD